MERDGRHLGWNFTEADPTAAADAYIAWALLRCVRGLPGALPSHNHDDLGSWIAPAVATFPADLVAALNSHNDPECREALAQDADVHALLGQHAVLLALGRGAAKGLPHFRGLLDAVEQRLLDFVARHPQRYTRNVQLLAGLLGLPAAEAAFLRLAAALNQGSLARANFTFVDTPARIARAMTLISGARGLALARMFENNSPLGQAGLLADMRATRPVRDLDDLLALSAVGEGLLSGCFDSAEGMAAAVLRRFDPPALGQRLAWPHLQQAQALLVATLQAAVARGERGVNILVHGEPGTGKTEFVRHLVAEAGVTAFAVDHLDGHGGEARREDRLASLRLCQTFAGRHERAVLVLDEAEDIFRDEYGSPLAGLLGRRSEGKAWMNQLLEGNRQPVVWISNRVSHLDPAYLRRFTFCLDVPRPPLALRREITQARLQPLGCRPETVEAVADSALMTPALASAAARFALLSAGSGLGADVAVHALVQGHGTACGHTQLLRGAATAIPFDTRHLHLAGPLRAEELMEVLRREGAGTVLFSGPPGTGKTQFAAEIARLLGRRLVVRTASDIHSKWYGESEGNVARMFRECDPRQELLFLDEADVLLGARGRAAHRADRAVTAEFLRWLEAFEGVFVCATNHPQDLDPALARRFVHRVAFEPLQLFQRVALFAELALGDAQAGVSPQAKAWLQRLDCLTPGDFANVQRRLRWLAADATRWLDELEAEQQAKPGAQAAVMGFL